eukprot:Platyproteum_vivax@DN5115_c0_g1_i1.p2
MTDHAMPSNASINMSPSNNVTQHQNMANGRVLYKPVVNQPGAGIVFQPIPTDPQPYEEIDVVTECWKVYETTNDGNSSWVTEWDVHTENLYDIFREVDENRDGLLDWKTPEMGNFISRIFAHHALPVPPVDETVWHDLFVASDKDKNNALDFKEAADFVLQLYHKILGFYPEVADQIEDEGGTKREGSAPPLRPVNNEAKGYRMPTSGMRSGMHGVMHDNGPSRHVQSTPMFAMTSGGGDASPFQL